MKKTLIALAVAGTFVAPAAFAASANVDFYGKFRVSVDNLSGSYFNGTSIGGWQMSDEQSRFGFKGAEDLGGGLKAIYQYETGFNIGADASTVATLVGTNNTGKTSSGGLGNQRDTFVGLSGDFGTVLAGRHDTPYKMAGSADNFGDTLADAQNGGALCIICEDLRVNNAIAYVSPSMSGFTVVGAIVTGHGAKATTTTKSLDSLADAYSLAGMYSNGPLSLSAGYENLNHFVGSAATGTGSAKQSAWKLNGAYTIDSLKLGATYEAIDKIGGVDGDKTRNYLLSAAYGMGPITLAAQYGYRNYNNQANTAGSTDLTDATVGVVYSLSKRTSTYIGYAHYKLKNNPTPASNGNINAVTLGLNHDF
jgi:predicted porin